MSKLIRSFFLKSVLIAFIPILLSGCYSSSKTTKFDELAKSQERDNLIRALTVDTTIYTFNRFSYTDSTLTGIGTRKKRGHKKTKYSGTLKFSDIALIERVKPNYWKALWIVPASVFIIAGINALNDISKFEISRPPEGSCPFVYSYDGSKYNLEAEAFSSSVSKALEAETFHLLHAFKPINGRLKVRIRNDRPETHFVNSVHLYAVDAKNSLKVVVGAKNKIWPVYHAIPPLKAKDQFHNDVLKILTEKDGKYWGSDLKKQRISSGFRDTLEVRFKKSQKNKEATLIISAINTDLITKAYRFASSVLGDDNLLFYQALEKDPEMQKLVREGIRKSSLTVEVFSGKKWQQIGVLPPQADVVPFTRAIRFEIPEPIHDPLRIRLSSMKNVWRIDAVSIDYYQGKPLNMIPLQMTSVVSTNNERNLEKAVNQNDSLYAVLMPPDHMDITFDSLPVKKMYNPTYVLSARGYLYEWLPDVKNANILPLPSGFKNVDRVEWLKYIMRHDQMFLPYVYKSL